MDTARYVMGVLAVVLLPPAIIYWIVIHPFARFWRRVGVTPTYVILAVSMTVVAVGFYLLRDAILGPPLETHWVLWVLAGLAFIASRVIEVWCRRYLDFKTLAGVPELRQDQETRPLLDQGPYAVVRHPRYVAVALGILGYALFVHYVGFYIVTLLSYASLGWVAWLEERELLASMGPRYAEYRARVPMFVPRRRSR